MVFRYASALGLVCLLLASVSFAQTSDYHLRVGASPARDIPLQEIDMSWVKDAPYGPAEGKRIQVFILDGMFGRRGPGESKSLQRYERVGYPNVLQFEDGRWQALKPVGIRYGYEFYFAQWMSEALEYETVGVIVGDGNTRKTLELVGQAMEAAPCDVVAYVRLAEATAKGELISDADKQRLSASNLIVYDRSPEYDFEYPYKGRLEAMHDQSHQIFRAVWKRMNTSKKDK